MSKLILLRHLKSQWNKENRFTGWVDVPLAKGETKKVKDVAKEIWRHRINRVYTSPLFRNMDTVAKLFEGAKKYPVFIHVDGGPMKDRARFKEIGKKSIPVFVSEKLNERHYGSLQGENKESIMKKYGREKVRLWRRSFTAKPPGGESLRDVVKRAAPFYKKFIEKDLKAGKNVLVVASHNALRALVKYIEKISDEDIINLEIPYAGSRLYHT